MGEAVTALGKFFGMSPTKGSDTVELGANTHQMRIAGEVLNIGIVLAIVKVKMDQKYGCVLSLQVKALQEDLCQMIIDSVS